MPDEQKVDLRTQLVKDQNAAETQLGGVLKQLNEVQAAQQLLTKQRLALETLINYLKTVLQTHAPTDTAGCS